MKFNIIIIAFLLTLSNGFSQNRIPPPPCYANHNTGAGGIIGNGYFLNPYSEDQDNQQFLFYGGDINHVLVIYIATSAPGRNIIDNSIDDATNAHTIAITNSNAYGFGSTITFPPGFEASYAIAIDTNSGALYSIPSSGIVQNGELGYVNSVNSTLTSNNQYGFDIDFNLSDIGVTSISEFYFVALYVGNDGYTYDEGYGEGITPGTQGSDNVTFTSARVLSGSGGCNMATLNNYEHKDNNIDAKYFNNKLHVNGLNEEVNIKVYDLLGRSILEIKRQINGYSEIPLDLLKNQLQFIMIETSNKRKFLKVLPTSR